MRLASLLHFFVVSLLYNVLNAAAIQDGREVQRERHSVKDEQDIRIAFTTAENPKIRSKRQPAYKFVVGNITDAMIIDCLSLYFNNTHKYYENPRNSRELARQASGFCVMQGFRKDMVDAILKVNYGRIPTIDMAKDAEKYIKSQ
ncbi:hypothetical protein F4779DRAFT_624214 [Xylariaceae sp. FL0662B]|nr:hypothetical protein F4779DRAFT_624214 [Xylariaceae sp. FL0662B]